MKSETLTEQTLTFRYIFWHCKDEAALMHAIEMYGQ